MSWSYSEEIVWGGHLCQEKQHGVCKKYKWFSIARLEHKVKSIWMVRWDWRNRREPIMKGPICHTKGTGPSFVGNKKCGKWPFLISYSDSNVEIGRTREKTSISALLTMPKTLTVWITINCGKFWKRWEYQTTRPASWETYMQVRKQQLELDMEQQTGSK